MVTFNGGIAHTCEIASVTVKSGEQYLISAVEHDYHTRPLPQLQITSDIHPKFIAMSSLHNHYGTANE